MTFPDIPNRQGMSGPEVERSPELGSPLRIYRLAETEPTLKQDLRYTVLEGVIGAVNTYQILSRDFLAKLQTSVNPQQQLANMQHLALGLEAVYPNVTLMHFSDDPKQVSDISQKLQQGAASFFGIDTEGENAGKIRYPQDTQFIDITVPTLDDLEGINLNLRSLDHDSRARIGFLCGYAELAERSLSRQNQSGFQNQLDITVGFARQLLSYLNNETFVLLTDTYRKEDISGLQIQGMLDSELHPLLTSNGIELGRSGMILNEQAITNLQDLKILIETEQTDPETTTTENQVVLSEIDQLITTFQRSQTTSQEIIGTISPSLMKRFGVVFSKVMLNEIMYNVYTNAVKSFRSKAQRRTQSLTNDPPTSQYPDSSVHQTNDSSLPEVDQVRFLMRFPDRVALELIFEDNGVGVDDEVEARGINAGNTKWDEGIQGSGEGLDSQRTKVVAKYQGDISLESVKLDNIKQGARVIIKLPLQRPK